MNRKSLPGVACALAALMIAVILWWPHQPPGAKVSDAPARQGVPSAVTSTPPAIGSAPARPTPAAVVRGMTPAVPGTPASASRAVPAIAAASPGMDTAARPAASPAIQAALIDLDKTERMIHDYHTLMGENPVGTNAEIMRAIMGGNSRQATLGPLDGQQLNANGELVDQWGTPYFFHQLSGDHMEIHSAGPDKIMGTSDDLIVK